MKIANNTAELIGNTPLVKLNHVAADLDKTTFINKLKIILL